MSVPLELSNATYENINKVWLILVHWTIDLYALLISLFALEPCSLMIFKDFVLNRNVKREMITRERIQLCSPR